MTVVFSFLLLLTSMIYLQAFFFRNYAKAEEQFLSGENSRRRAKLKQNSFPGAIQQGAETGSPVVAIISAAISAHRKQTPLPKS